MTLMPSCLLLQVFDSMIELGIPANVKIYTSLIDACVQARGEEWTEVRRVGRAGRLCEF